jgi:iron(III) transport system substrate-binding protein
LFVEAQVFHTVDDYPINNWREDMTRKSWMSVFVVTFTILCSLSAVRGQGMDKIVQGAKKEGQLKLGITLRWEVAGQPSGKKLIEAFQARYPFVKVDFQRVGGTREREKVFTELTAGRVSYDVTVMTVSQVPNVLKADVVEQVDWRSLGVRPEDIAPHALGVNYQYGVFGIAYNKKLVPDAEASKLTWENCVDSKWRKKVAMNDTPVHLEVLWQPHAWGRERTLDHARRLVSNQTVFEQSNEDILNKVALGEYHLTCGNVHQNILEQITFKGVTALGFVTPEPVPVASRAIVYVPRGAAHPNAAKLWVLWSLSDDAQKVLDEIDFTGSPALPATAAGKMVKGKKLVWYEPEWQLKAREIRKDILEALGFPVVR